MGGNIFKDKTQSIRKENIGNTLDKYFNELKRVFPAKSKIFNLKFFKPVGSVGKKDLSGDIDLAIDISSLFDKRFSDSSIEKWGLNPESVRKQFLDFKKRSRTATDAEIMTRSLLKGIVTKINAYSENIYCDEKKITIGNIFGYFPQYNEQEENLGYGVQIDWLIGDLDLLEFSYYSTSYSSNVKGLHRTQLILSMFQNLGYSFNHTKGLSDKETGEVVAIKPDKILEILSDEMGIKISRNASNDYFELIKIVNKSSLREEILATYFKILDRTRCDIPSDLQDDWKRLKGKLGLTGKFLPDDSMLIESRTEQKYFKEFLND